MPVMWMKMLSGPNFPAGQLVEDRLHAERADHMQGDRNAEFAAERPGFLMEGQIDLAAHDHGQQPVVA
ncbi:Hypothetical protein NGAL_HAMBI2610_23080 [Neorhizobium galegae bv. orientalis]|nr:Hypothetical protein NGAL_HAMBI2610_23080 [Neorhizobium galegae bv. orientalis]